eukprot:PhM_4_TR9039/c0_g2_i1/m.48836/K03667/hslU; ATP-dependent HslUV protease ATP-binding subunit HslU
MATTVQKGVVKSASSYTPAETLAILNDYIIGQSKAKRAMAVALRNRWRRNNIADADLRASVMPKNILMVGPTGVGKTEISRRMAKLTDAPFLKVEATKYTEVGFKGKDVDTIIEDLYAVSKSMARKQLEKARSAEAAETVATKLVERLAERKNISAEEAKALLDSGAAEDESISYEITIFEDESKKIGELRGDGQNLNLIAADLDMPAVRKAVTRPVKEAREDLMKEELHKLIPPAAVTQLAVHLCQEEGIVFVDEIDKVVVASGSRSTDTSAEGVQQDLLPIVEGTTVTMKDNSAVKTDNILFICSGAFHTVKPSDMIAELQGRLPVRVELEALTESDFYRILTTPKFNLLRQHEAMMKAEDITLTFDDGAVKELARTALDVNTHTQNIGARRLHTILEQVMESYSYDVETYSGKSVAVTKEVVVASVEKFRQKMDLAKYLL